MEQIVAAAISAFATIVAAFITVHGARKSAQPTTNSSQNQSVATASWLKHLSPAVDKNMRVWGLVFSFALVWILLSPKLIHGVLIAPNWLVILPAITIAASLIWPIRPSAAPVIVFFLHAVNLFMSAFFGEIWEKGAEAYTIIVLISIVGINGFIASVFCSLRLQKLRA